MEQYRNVLSDKYIMYLRKSQMDKDFEEESVEETLRRHRKRLEEFAKANNLYVAVILEEVVSGESLSSRPRMLECLELVNTGEYAGVICMDIDRLSRGNSMDSGYITQVLQVNNCKIVTPSKTYDLANESDEQFTDMKFMFSRYEFKTINKRLKNGREASVSEGKFVGSVAPYGYERYKLEGIKGYSLKINSEQAHVVKMIFDLYTEKGLGYGKIVRELDRLGIQPSPPISFWDRHVIERILKNPVYIGMIRYKFKPVEKTFEDGKMVKKRHRNRENCEFHEGLHEPIISMDQWEKSLEARKNNLPVTVNRELCNPFSRIVKCKKCGRTIIRRTTSQHPVKYRLSCPNRQCDCRSIFLESFEEAVVKEMTAWLDKYTITIKNHTVTVDENLVASLQQIEKQIVDAEVQQEKICDLLEKGIYTIEMFSKRNEKLQSEINNLKSSAQKIKSEIKKQEERANNSTEIVPKVQHILDSYDSLNPQQKNDLWQEVLHKIEFYAEPKGKDFHIDLYPKI